jgi:hypothetical protein
MPYRVEIWNKIAIVVTPFLKGKGKLVFMPWYEGGGEVKVKHYSILNLALALSDFSKNSCISYFFSKSRVWRHFFFSSSCSLLLSYSSTLPRSSSPASQ